MTTSQCELGAATYINWINMPSWKLHEVGPFPIHRHWSSLLKSSTHKVDLSQNQNRKGPLPCEKQFLSKNSWVTCPILDQWFRHPDGYLADTQTVTGFIGV
jgi:hypothetical protein